MMKKQIFILLSLLVTIVHTSFTIVDEGWEEAYKNKETIIYTRTASDGIKEFKAITTLNVNIKTVLAVLIDYQSHPNWMRSIKSCEMVNQVTPKTRYLHYAIDMPWPLWDRDVVSKSTFYKQTDGSVLMKIKGEPTMKPHTPNHVRIMISEGFWKVTPSGSSKTKIIYQYKADPVDINSSLVNMFLLEGPKETFVGLEKQVKLSKYQNSKIDWLE